MRPVRTRMAKVAGALLLVAAAVSGSVAAGAPPADSPSAPAGPSPITGIAWQADVTANGYAVAGDTVVATGPHEVTGIDVRSGATRWRYEPPSGSSIVSWAVTGGAVALGVDATPEGAAGPYNRWETVGLDAGTGRRLWQAEQRAELLPSPDYFLTGGSPDQLASGGGVVVVPRYFGVAGVDARTGDLAWVQPFYEVAGGQCEILVGGDFLGTARPLVAAEDRIAAVAAWCADGLVVIGVDPHTGDVRWATPLPGGEPDRLLVDGAILVGQSRRSTILDHGGRIVYEGDLPPNERVMAVAGDVAVVSGTDGASDPLVAVDLRGGRIPWSHPQSGSEPGFQFRRSTYQSLATIDGAVLGYRYAAGGRTSGPRSGPVPDENFLPSAIDRIDPATGAIRSVAIPLAGVGDWITVVDDLLLLESARGLSAIHLTSDGLPSTANAPAAPDKWPDACALVTVDQISALRPNTQPTLEKQSADVLGLPIPNPVQCHYLDPNGDGFLIIAIRWVADDPRSAEALATDARHMSAGSIWSEHPEEPLLPAVGTWAFGKPTTSVTLRVGPVIAEVRSWDVVTVPAVEIARLAGERLRDLGYR